MSNLLIASNQVYSSGESVVDLTDGLVAHYPLNDDSQAKDWTTDYDLTEGSAHTFSDTYIQSTTGNTLYTSTFPDLSADSFSASYWISKTTTGNMWIDTKGNYSANTYVWDAIIVSGTCHFTLRLSDDSNFSVEWDDAIADDTSGTWYNLVAVWDSSTKTLTTYVNGVLAFSDTTTGTVKTATNQELWLGCGSNGVNFVGNMSNVRYYNRAINEDEVAALYAEGLKPSLPQPTTENLVAHYPLTGTAENAQGEGTNVDESIFGGSKVAVFDGSTSYIRTDDAPFDPVNDTWTISVWVSMNALNATAEPILCYQRNDMDNQNTFLDVGTVGFRSSTINEGAIGFIPEINTWYCLTQTYDGTNCNTYVNGELQLSASGTAPDPLSTTQPYFFIGHRPFASTYFNGKISNIKMYNTVLSTTDIADLYAEGTDSTVTPTTTGLVAHYKLESGLGSDITGGNNGTNTNVTVVNDATRGWVGSFNGSSYIVSNSNLGITGSTPLSVSIWVKTTASWNGHAAMALGTSSGPDTLFSLQTYSGNAFLSTAGHNLQKGAVNNNAWHLMVGTYDGTTLKLYVDNGTPATTTATMNIVDNVLYIGCQNSVNYHWSGNLSDLRIYDRALEAAEILDLYDGTDVTDGLIAHYPLEGVIDEVGTYQGADYNGVSYSENYGDRWVSYDGTENGGLLYTDDSIRGSVGNFDGSNDYVSLGTDMWVNSNFTSGFSICAWVLWDGATTCNGYANYSSTPITDSVTHPIVYNGNYYNDAGITFSFQADTLSFRTGTHADNSQSNYLTINSTIPISANEWHHAIYWCDGSDLKLYVDGVLQGTTLFSSGTVVYTDLFDSGDFCNIGARSPEDLYGSTPAVDSSTTFSGLDISNVRFYNRALTADEITTIYRSERVEHPITIDDGLVAFYPLENNSKDNCFNQYDGTDVGDTSFDGTSAQMDGTGDYITIPYMIDPTQGCTWSMWFKRDAGSNSTDTILLDQDSNATGTPLPFGITESTGNIFMRSGGASISTGVVNELGVWQHVLLTGDSTNLYAYVDGVLVGTDTNGLVNENGTSYSIGRTSGNSTYNLNGSAANLRIYDRLLSGEEVDIIYNTEKTKFGL